MDDPEPVLRVMKDVLTGNHPDATVQDDVTTGDCDYRVGMMGPDVATASGIGANEVTDADINEIETQLESELDLDVEVDTDFGIQFLLDD